MTHEEETNLATAIMYREGFGIEAGIHAATQMKLAEDLTQLLKAGVEVDETEDEAAPGGIGYVFTIPTAEGTH
jgi:hypothetical protein